MKAITRLLTSAALASLLVTAAVAQQPGVPARHFEIYNCSALKGDSHVCLFNETSATITDIDCEGSWWGTRSVSLPKGGIAPFSMTIVDMKSCHTALIFTVLGGVERKTGKINTDEATIIEVPSR